MKKIVLICTLAILYLNSFSQECEEREQKLLTSLGGFSAVMLYNTYELINISKDAFLEKIHEKEKVNQLMDSQKGMADALISMLENGLKEKTFTKEDDKKFAESLTETVKGLKKQATLLINITEANTSANADAYEKQQKKNWAEIAKLLGLEKE